MEAHTDKKNDKHVKCLNFCLHFNSATRALTYARLRLGTVVWASVWVCSGDAIGRLYDGRYFSV